MDLVVWLQESAGWLTPVMRAITHLGDEEFYLLAFPLLYWCVHPRTGLRLGVILLVSSSLNGALKLAFATPRPYWLGGGIDAGALEPSFGTPSGHAQNGVAVWGLLAHETGRRWTWVAAGLLAFALGLSRVHLGAHFAGDVVAGWLAGALLLAAFVRLRPPTAAWLARRSATGVAAVSLAAGLALVTVGALAMLGSAAFELPADWVAAAGAAGQAELDPRTLRAVVTPAGALAGLGLGVVVLRAGGGFVVAASGWRVVLRYPLGVAGVILLWAGLDAALPGGDTLVGVGARFLRYGLVGAWIGGLAPLLFVRIGLARAAEPRRAPPGAGTARRPPRSTPP